MADMDLDCGRVAPLDDDVLAEILVQLPVQSLMRLRAVSKSWCSLISTNNFFHLHALHRLRHPQPLVLVTRFWPDPLITKEKAVFSIFNPIIKPTDKKLSTKPFNILEINNSKIVSSSNGLMLLRFQHDCEGYYVHNPSTRKSRQLGFPYREESEESEKSEKSYTHIVSIHIVFDPSSDSLHYKIVCVWAKEKPPKLRLHTRVQSYLIEVYASERRKWSVRVGPFDSDKRMDFSGCVQCNNLVFLVHSKPSYGPICCFDIAKNVSNLIEIPEPIYANSRSYSHLLQVSNGCVYYCALFVGANDKSAALWELRVNGDKDIRRFQWLLKYANVVGLPNGSNLLRFIKETSTVLIHAKEKIVGYNFVDTSCKVLLDLDSQAHEFFFFKSGGNAYANVYEFGETLAPL